MKAAVALLLFIVLINTLLVEVTWRSAILADAAAVIGGMAAVLWIFHDFSERIGAAADRFFSGLHTRAFFLLKVTAFVFSVGLWFIASNALYVALVQYVANKGLLANMLIGALTELGPWVVGIALAYFIIRRIRNDRPLPRFLEQLFDLSAWIAVLMFHSSGKDPAGLKPVDWLFFGIFMLMVVANILFFFPSLILALTFNAVLIRVLNWGWLVLSSPVSAAETLQDWGEARSITLAVVFVLTVISVSILLLSVCLKYGYGV